MARLVGGRWLKAAERKGGKDGEEFFLQSKDTKLLAWLLQGRALCQSAGFLCNQTRPLGSPAIGP